MITKTKILKDKKNTLENIGEYSVRFVDYNWVHFVKTSVLSRCWTRCLDMSVRHHSVPCFAFLEICFKHEIS